MIRITVSSSVPRTAVLVRATPTHQGAARFVRRGTTETLHIRSPRTKSRVQWIRDLRSLVRTARTHHITSLAISWNDIVGKRETETERSAQQCAEAIIMAAYEFTAYRSPSDEEAPPVRTVTILCDSAAVRRAIRSGIRHGTIVATWTNHARDLANTPGGDLTPASFARTVRSLARTVSGVRVRVLTPKQIRAKKMNGILAVGQGSNATPRVIIVEYAGANTAPTVIVGKGVTFDSGGLDVKPYPHATEMMMDMSGGAVAICSVLALAQLRARVHAVAVVPAVENMPSGSSMRPGDILRMMSGTTVEIRNTDAEGRLILADALTYAQRTYAPAQLLDIATLTGASLVALGEEAHAVMTREEHNILRSAICAAGEESGDRVWPLPLWDEYDAYLKSTRADLANVSSGSRDRYAGTITAGAFLKRFVDSSVPWAHIDMAPRMTAGSDEQLSPGSSGDGVRLLTTVLLSRRRH